MVVSLVGHVRGKYMMKIKKVKFSGDCLDIFINTFIWISRNLRTPIPKGDFNKAALQLYWNHSSAWVFSCKFPYLSKVTPMESPLWGPHIIQWNVMVSRSKTTINSNKAKWICTSLKAFKAKSNKGLKRIDTSTRG